MRREDRLQQREDRLTDKTSDLRAQIASLTAEIERLRALAIRAYAEAFEDANEFYPAMTDFKECWLTSSTRAALQHKEGEG